MDRHAPDPWRPDRTWADPFIATLALLIVVLVSANARAHRSKPAPPPAQVELQGRLEDLALAAPKALGALAGSSLAPRDAVGDFARKPQGGWDRAVLAVHAGLKGDTALGAHLAVDAPGEAGDTFRLAYGWAFQGTGRPPLPVELQKVRQALGGGYAAELLEARCIARSGGNPGPLERRALDWVLPRLAGLAVAGFLALILVLGGLAFLLWLALASSKPKALPAFGLSGRAALIVLLGWFLTHLASGFVISIVVSALPFLRPLALPLMYALHAGLGTAYLCWAEGIPFRTLWARLVPEAHGRALAMGLGFFALAFTAVMAIALVLSPFLTHAEPPQRELMDLLTHLRGPLPLALMFLTVAVLAPAFEELMFRGFMLPWLGQRLATRLGPRAGWILAVAVSGLTFGAMHLQPLGLPTLATLGIVLGFAFLRTGNLLTSILVHGLWNGGIFILMRLLA